MLCFCQNSQAPQGTISSAPLSFTENCNITECSQIQLRLGCVQTYSKRIDKSQPTARRTFESQSWIHPPFAQALQRSPTQVWQGGQSPSPVRSLLIPCIPTLLTAWSPLAWLSPAFPHLCSGVTFSMNSQNPYRNATTSLPASPGAPPHARGPVMRV